MAQGTDVVLHDYYDGALFRENVKDILSNSDPAADVAIFMTMSSDGVELFKGRDGECSCWPVMFTILNLGVEHRFRAANALLTAFIPGSHDGNHFDTFLYPLVEDLLLLEEGISVLCADGKVRLMRAFIIFCTADWPGSTKLSGFVGHNAARPCRLCLRQTTNRVLPPIGTMRMMRKAIEGGSECTDWLDAECPDIRTEQYIRHVWGMLDATDGSKARINGQSHSAVMRSTGIKRRPVLSMLSIKFPNAFPYDCMHLLLQGWVKLLITLLCGIHPKTVAMGSPFVLKSDSLSRMNSALKHSPRGFPAAWGRPPPSIENLASYKAETFKTFRLFHGPALFSGVGINKRVSELWAVTRDMLFIAFDPTPSLNDLRFLSDLVQRAHALFAMIFRVNDSHNFCFTPTTHAILHLPDIMRNCGPLMNTSQFLPERVMGEVKRQARSHVLPEANLFHKSQMLFGLRVFGGGLRKFSQSNETSRSISLDSFDGIEHESTESHGWELVGRGKLVSSEGRSTRRDLKSRNHTITSIF